MKKNITITVIEKFCKHCGICASLCPRHVLEQKMGEPPQVVNLDACIACKLCAMRCPDFAIEVEVEG
jgi:2-oxoglutarate ferredoxin oxidoreductase subunit delta